MGSMQRTSASRLLQNWVVRLCWLAVCWLAATPIEAAEGLWKAGVARCDITPTEALWLAGYGNRDKPAEGKAMDLWLKVLALEDEQGHRGVIVTSDTLGIPQSIYRHSCEKLKATFGLEASQIVLCASHTHCGPVLRGALYDAYPLDEHQRLLIEKYSEEFESKIVEAISKALTDLAPARLSAGQGTSGFAVNRRNNPEAKVPKLIEQGTLKGPVDHSVPVLAVFQPDGRLKAFLFGYACHNTVMGFYQWCGDYAGFAQLALEKSHPGATAMFFMGCGGDQNPLPRRKLEFAERYGQMLAAAVEEVLISPPRSLPPRLKTSLETITLNFGPVPTEAELEQMKSGINATARRWATRWLADLKADKPLARSYPYPIQSWRLGGSQLLLALGGEPVVDYALKFKREFGPDTWVAGYCNDVMGYIPSLRVLKEGGYEGGGSMLPYGQPALRWADDVEDVITAAAKRLVEKKIN